MIDKTYNAYNTESQIFDIWEKEGIFRTDISNKKKEHFSIVMPPPNITGVLHMGHALNVTIQDVLVRFERMRGKNVLWQPGIDHAGIATQIVVERHLENHKKCTRQEIGREKFFDYVWKWYKEYGSIISKQLKRLGASCNWSRERFTMDEGFSRAVTKVFVDLYKDDLIYKDKRLVNWDPFLLTAISDLEVEQKEINGKCWYLRYPLQGINFDPNNPSTFIVIATTRPETIFGDTAVAVHPKDDRFFNNIKKNVILPLFGRIIPIIQDSYICPNFGSGAVKITPAHDFNDFEIGRRNNLDIINILDKKASISLKNNFSFLKDIQKSKKTEKLINDLDRLDRFSARDKIINLMHQEGYFDRVEQFTHTVPHGDRSGVPIEPMLTDQWYVRVNKLSKSVNFSIKSRNTEFIPSKWEKISINWLDNIKPWCISRQLWWGHKIPAWYGPDNKIFVEQSETEAIQASINYYGSSVKLVRDQDVLDTWFSSAIWPFVTLGWPDNQSELSKFYPTNVLVTGFDIIFFWVSRMMMMGLYFLKKVPFHKIYVHSLICDKNSLKMSKSKGNIIDPVFLIDKYGADVLRFFLISTSHQGSDIKFDQDLIISYRNFRTKLWNATRFCLLQGATYNSNFEIEKVELSINRWILHELSKTLLSVTKNISKYHLNDAAKEIYIFFWNQFCDWYLELLKPLLKSSNEKDLQEIKECLGFCLKNIYQLLHPFMPFVTEYLWINTFKPQEKNFSFLATSRWPVLNFCDYNSVSNITWLINLITKIRSLRVEMNINAKSNIFLVIYNSDYITKIRINSFKEILKEIIQIQDINFSNSIPSESMQIILEKVNFFILFQNNFLQKSEQERLNKQLNKITENIKKIVHKLNKTEFSKYAAKDLILKEYEKLKIQYILRGKVEKSLLRLSKNFSN